MDLLLHDAKFWLAIVLLAKVILFYVIPTFPEQIWVAFDALLAVVIGTLAGSEVRRAVVERRVRRSIEGRP